MLLGSKWIIAQIWKLYYYNKNQERIGLKNKRNEILILY